MMTIGTPTLEERILQILVLTAVVKRKCTACDKPLYFLLHQSTKTLTPYTADGINHKTACQRERAQKAEAG